jgi:anti-sigma factor (TIGR02949 family)
MGLCPPTEKPSLPTMADCEDTLRELQLFLAKELSPRTQTAISSHLDGCTDCLQAFDFHAELKSVIARKAREQTMPEGLMARIQQCFSLEQTSPFDQQSPFDQPSPFSG